MPYPTQPSAYLRDSATDRPNPLTRAIRPVVESLESRRLLSTTLYTEPFDEPVGSTAGNVEGGGAWNTFDRNRGSGVASVNGAGGFAISGTAGVVSWYTSDLDISGDPVDLSIDLADVGDPAGRISVYTRIDGVRTRIARFVGGVPDGQTTITAEGLTGSTLQVEVQVDSATDGYTLDNLLVTRPGDEQRVRIEGDTVFGTDGDDDIVINFTDDSPSGSIAVLDGDRLVGIVSDDANLTVRLGDGDDRLSYEGFGSLTALGDAGDDRITSTGAGSTLHGGAGNDELQANASGTRFFGDAGNDTLTATNGSDMVLRGGDGDDVISTNKSSALGYGDAGNDTFRAGAFNNPTFFGGDGDDTFLAYSGPSSITAFGEAGNDTFLNTAGDDVFDGGTGNDTADYRDFSGNDTGALVSNDGLANDGVPGAEMDNITDVETVLGGMFVDDERDVLYREDFSGEIGRSGTIEGGGVWDVFDRNVGDGTAEAARGAFRTFNTAGVVSWYTSDLDITGGPVDFTIDLRDVGEPTGRISVYTRVDGVRNRIARFVGGIPDGQTTVSASGLTGSALQVEVQVASATGGYAFDDLLVTRTTSATTGVTAELSADALQRIEGTPAPGRISVSARADADDNAVLDVFDVDTLLGTFADLTSISINGRAAGDTIDVDLLIEGSAAPGVYSDARLSVNAGSEDAAGDENVITIRGDASVFGRAGDDEITIEGVGSVSTGDGDNRVTLKSFNRSLRGPTRIEGSLIGGDGDDTFVLVSEHEAVTDVGVGGGFGDDRLEIDTPRTSLDAEGGITFQGGAGTDTVAYVGAPGAVVTRDGIANDGYPGRYFNANPDDRVLPGRDNILRTVELVEGADDQTLPGRYFNVEGFDELEGSRSGSLGVSGRWETFDRNLGVGTAGVFDNTYVIADTAGVVSWYTTEFRILDGPVDLRLDLSDVGDPSGRVSVYVRVDGQRQRVARFTGGGSEPILVTGIEGEQLQIEVQVDSANGGYRFDNLTVNRPEAS